MSFKINFRVKQQRSNVIPVTFVYVVKALDNVA